MILNKLELNCSKLRAVTMIVRKPSKLEHGIQLRLGISLRFLLSTIKRKGGGGVSEACWAKLGLTYYVL